MSEPVFHRTKSGRLVYGTPEEAKERAEKRRIELKVENAHIRKMVLDIVCEAYENYWKEKARGFTWVKEPDLTLAYIAGDVLFNRGSGPLWIPRKGEERGGVRARALKRLRTQIWSVTERLVKEGVLGVSTGGEAKAYEPTHDPETYAPTPETTAKLRALIEENDRLERLALREKEKAEEAADREESERKWKEAQEEFRAR